MEDFFIVGVNPLATQTSEPTDSTLTKVKIKLQCYTNTNCVKRVGRVGTKLQVIGVALYVYFKDLNPKRKTPLLKYICNCLDLQYFYF